MISKIDNFRVLGDERGKLIALEGEREIPFDIKRVFYIYGTQKNIPRGEHAHYNTKQFLIALNGSCQVTLDNGEIKETYTLNQLHMGLFQDTMIWGTMHNFSKDCILLVMANEYYDESDYIRNYNKFLKEIKHDS